MRLVEFTACCRAYNRQRTAEIHDDWERMRMLATITIQPHVKGKLTPQRLLPFEWEKPKRRRNAEAISKEESKARFEELVKGHL